MLHFINADLFSQKEMDNVVEGANLGCKINILTAPKVLRGEDPVAKHQLFTQIRSVEDLEECKSIYEKCANIRHYHSANGKDSAYIDANKGNKESYVVLVALPFNGFAEPLPETTDYRIHRGMFVKSDRKTILCNGKKYKKVLYLLVEVNAARFDPEHRNYAEELKLVFSSYNLETTPEAVNTIKTTSCVTFRKDAWGYDETSVQVDPVSADDFKGKTIFTVYKNEKTKADNKQEYTKKNESLNIDSLNAKFSGKDSKKSGKKSHNKNKKFGRKYY